jgi:4-hydroxyphenylpyruvate dioxygenase
MQDKPDTSSVLGIEFLEFATFGDADAAGLRSVLEAIGFVLCGRHRSKNVLLFRQGGINLAVNSEPSSFAHSYATTHGTSVCAMGLRVTDASRLHDLALRRGAQDYIGRIGYGESVLPAIRSVSGRLVYLVGDQYSARSVYDIDFLPTPSSASDPAVGLKAIDHISQSVPIGGTKKWVRFYSRLFGLHVIDHTCIIDPAGRTLSTVIADAERRVQICMNEPVDEGTDCDRFLRENFGEGIQHIAFATDDIFEFLQAATKRGLDVLPLKGAYHDDLLDEGYAPELVEKLRRHRVMIDTEGGGRFLHAYTQPVDGRIFFEIVQRTHHKGFGRHDVTARLLAQRGMSRLPDSIPTAPVLPDVSDTSIDGSTQILGIVGDPTSHLRMPEIMGHWLALNGRNAVWLPFHVTVDNLAQFVNGARSMENMTGFAVAWPHKVRILPLLDEVTRRARMVGAVNIVKRDADHRLIGDIVDGPGFVKGFDALGGSLDDATVWLFGAGNAGRAIAFALAEREIRHLFVHDVESSRAKGLITILAEEFPGLKVSRGSPPDPHAIDLAINATPAGMELDDALPFKPSILRPSAWVADTVMNPDMTGLLVEAERHGCRIYPGRRMLESQVEDYIQFFGWKD